MLVLHRLDCFPPPLSFLPSTPNSPPSRILTSYPTLLLHMSDTATRNTAVLSNIRRVFPETTNCCCSGGYLFAKLGGGVFDWRLAACEIEERAKDITTTAAVHAILDIFNVIPEQSIRNILNVDIQRVSFLLLFLSIPTSCSFSHF